MDLRCVTWHALAGSIVVAVACAHPEPRPPEPPPPAPVPTPVATSVVPAVVADPSPPDAGAPDANPEPRTGPYPAEWASHLPTAWTDPRVVGALAESCDLLPVPPPPESASTPEDVFSCVLPFDQTCYPSECDEESEACRRDCQSGCGSCGASCVGHCNGCEASCKDAACRRACAANTAECRQSCVRTMDRCQTATCTKEEVSCKRASTKAWQTNHCNDRCPVFEKCTEACKASPDDSRDACDKGCSEQIAPGYLACVGACGSLKGFAYAKCHRACEIDKPCAPRRCQQMMAF